MIEGRPLANVIAAGELSARAARNPAPLKTVYEAAAKILMADPTYADVSLVLEKSLQDGKVVYLLDKDLDAPFSLNAAPIHKLLVAHAREYGSITYKRGSASLADDHVEFAGLRIPAPPKTYVIIRHGPKFGFGRLLSDDEIEDLRERQLRLADKQADPVWKEPYPVPSILRPRNLDDPSFIESRALLAQRAVRSLVEDADILPLKDRLRAIYGGAIPLGAPRQLFGIPVENEVRDRIQGIGG